MKNFFKYLFSKKIILAVSLICSFLLGFFVCNIRNNNKAYYIASFSIDSSETFDTNKLTSCDYLVSIKDSAEKYSNINVEKMLKHNGFYVEQDNNRYTIKTGYKYYDKFFINSSRTLSTRAKMYVKDSVTTINKNAVFDDSKNIVTLTNYQNEYVWGGYGLLLGFILSLVTLTILFLLIKDNKINEFNEPFIYDNITTFKTCFHKAYWRFPLRKVKDITMVSMLFAIMIACKFIPLPSGFGDLGLSFTYLFFSMIGLLYGPVVGFIIGIFSDIIGFFINSTGVFNIGYTLQAAFTGAIYGFCFYKTKVSFSKVLLARLLVNSLMNVAFGSFLYTTTFCESPWFSQDFNDFFRTYLLVFSLPKNIFYLLPQSILLFAIFKLVFPIFKKNKLISDNVYKHMLAF